MVQVSRIFILFIYTAYTSLTTTTLFCNKSRKREAKFGLRPPQCKIWCSLFQKQSKYQINVFKSLLKPWQGPAGLDRLTSIRREQEEGSLSFSTDEAVCACVFVVCFLVLIFIYFTLLYWKAVWFAFLVSVAVTFNFT